MTSYCVINFLTIMSVSYIHHDMNSLLVVKYYQCYPKNNVVITNMLIFSAELTIGGKKNQRILMKKGSNSCSAF